MAASFFIVLLALCDGVFGQVAGNHPEWPRWCGKAYMAGYPSFNPGGQTVPPPTVPQQLLYVQVQPKHSIYVSSEKSGTLIVDAALSHSFGSPIGSITQASELSVAASIDGKIVVSGKVLVGSTDNLLQFDFSHITPQMAAHSITLHATTTCSEESYSYTATSELFYLPDKITGSVVKIDNLYGGMLYKNAATKDTFEPLLPYGFYVNYGGYFDQSIANIQSYADKGYNTAHPVPTFSDNLTTIFDYADTINLLWQYDMRGDYQNLTSVAEQVASVKDHPSLLSWYTADEPDGWEYALNSTKLAYDTIVTIDKYHPVGLVLNCQDFYFKEYTSGADYIYEDAYPVGINATYSIPWGTVCNDTVGDCGCDNCEGSLADVPDRMDDFTKYQEWLGQLQKPKWAVGQAFSGEGYWSRNPTAAEAWVMSISALNHGAKGVTNWIYPTTDELATAHGQLAKVVTAQPVLGYLVGAKQVKVAVNGVPSLDVAYSIVGNKALISVASLSSSISPGTVKLSLPFKVAKIESQPWGSLKWSTSGSRLSVSGVTALATSMVIVDISK